MPPTGDWAGQNSLLSGLFGVLQQAATNRLDTATVWDQLRINAAQWEQQITGQTSGSSDADLAQRGAEILKQSGVGIAQVNAYRAVAGQWLSAKQTVQSEGGDQQLTARSVFRPPWATTVGGEQSDRYRIRVNWQVTPTAGDVFNKWSTYELTSPLTTIDQALAHAQGKALGDKYLVLLSGGAPLQVTDYEIEQI